MDKNTSELDKSRAEFEAWYAQRHPQPVHENSTWAHASKMDDWEVWQAAIARRSLPVKPTELPADLSYILEYIPSEAARNEARRHIENYLRAALAAKGQQEACSGNALQTATNALQFLALNRVPHNPRAVAQGALDAMQLLAATHQAAEVAEPVSIYQARTENAKEWTDVSRDVWQFVDADRRRIVYTATVSAAPAAPTSWRDALRRSGANTDYHGLIAFTPTQLENFVSRLAAPTAAVEPSEQPLIGKLLDQFSALPVLWGLGEPGALLRHSDVFKMLVDAGKAQKEGTSEQDAKDAARWRETVQRICWRHTEHGAIWSLDLPAPRTNGGNTDEDFIAAIDAAMSAAPAQDTTKEKA